ncbi:MAG: hypothetical protein M3463_22030 [Verrucomicrobiota bacterium]|nr:hypothetical protein [Verrucomicrobiota bacterium]
MNTKLLTLALAFVATSPLHAALPTDEAGAIAYLTNKGVEITKNADGHAVRLMSSGKEKLSPEEYALIGKLTHLEQAGLNDAPLTESQWAFLRSLPKLKRLSIWHGHGFASLEGFCGLPVESLTIGGCMGLRDRNKGDPEKLRHAIKTLRDLPNLKKGNWYHSPLAPDDSHLVHIATEFPQLEDLRLDFNATAGSQTTITPAGLAQLHKLPLTTLSLENAHTFTAEHFKALAGIKSLKVLLVDARRKAVSADAIAAFQQARPDVEVVVADENAKEPPVAKRKGP